MRPSRRQTSPFIRRWAAGYPSATALLIAVCAGAYVSQCIVELMLTDPETKGVLWRWLALDGASIRAGQYWKFLTFGFLHSGPWPFHLLGNMLLLYFAGREVEPIVGTRHFLCIFGFGNLLGGVADWLASPWQVVGVSAGVAAVIVAFTTILPELEVTLHLFFLLPLRLRAKHLAMALLATSAFFAPSHYPEAAVIGAAGIFAGSLFGWLYAKQLGFGNPLPIQRYIFKRRQRASRLARMSADQFMTVEIDPILEKISREGMRSLSRSERKLLVQGREKIIGKNCRK